MAVQRLAIGDVVWAMSYDARGLGKVRPMVVIGIESASDDGAICGCVTTR